MYDDRFNYYAKIAVDKTNNSFDRLFDYRVPAQLLKDIQPGCRVIVPFGRSNKKLQGLVFSVKKMDEQVCERKLKFIVSLLDKTPIADKKMFGIIKYLSDNTFCTFYEAVRTILPPGMNVDIALNYKLEKDKSEIDFKSFSVLEQNFINHIYDCTNQLQLNKLLDSTAQPNKRQMVEKFEQLGIISSELAAKRKVAEKNVRMIKLNDDIDYSAVKLTKKQKAVVEFLSDNGFAEIKEAAYFSGVGETVIKNLLKNEIVLSYDITEDEINSGGNNEIKNNGFGEDMVYDIPELSANQEKIYEGLKNITDMNKPSVSLLYGVTGSGKTQIYIKLIDYVVSRNKQVIMMVPEIALTSQMVKRFKDIFSEKVAVIHSGLTIVQRLEEWEKIKKGEKPIVVGTRSAVFSPCSDIGLIIMDEEGEPSYKSDASPRYHAREIAKLRAVQDSCHLLLGSATPSVESYYYALTGRYNLFELDERYNNLMLPQVMIADMSSKENLYSESAFSQTLIYEIQKTLDASEQVILLLNRRGYSTSAVCMDCGETVNCPNCDLPLTYHKANGLMMCHYCEYTRDKIEACPSCGSRNIYYVGSGTQKIEDEVQRLFPDSRVVRMDTDTVFSKDKYKKTFDDFYNRKYDIMIGTQMIAKGLDFPGVTLVGVLNADQGLYSGDFQSPQRVFSLITQVIGRSGRSDKPGRAVIQTHTPENEIIRFASLQDYRSFYDYEISFRKKMIYPPFCDICLISCSCENEQTAKRAAVYFVERLKSLCIEQKEMIQNEGVAIRVLGVSPSDIYKISNKYRYKAIIKCKNSKALRNIIRAVLADTKNNNEFSKVHIYADINAVSVC